MDASPENIETEPVDRLVISFQYFELPDPRCQACNQNQATVMRVGAHFHGGLVVTGLCAGCAQKEVDALVDSGEMVKGPDNVLVIRSLVESAQNAKKMADEDRGTDGEA